MTFLIVTSVPHVNDGSIRSYLPYVREMNIWIRNAGKVIVLAPCCKDSEGLLLSYEHPEIELVSIPEIDIKNGWNLVRALFLMPLIVYRMLGAMRRADHIHLRCPGNIGLIGCVLQSFFPAKKKTAKYAGNWDPDASRPLTYRLQQKLLSNTRFCRNMTVLAYGNWKGATTNIRPSFTASYREHEIRPFLKAMDMRPFRFVYAGMLVPGKNPLYALRLVEALNRHFPCVLELFGDGPERTSLESYIASKGLGSIAKIRGNQAAGIVASAYQQAHFTLLPSTSEGWPKALAEGMFWGCVPLALPVSCIPEMLANGERGELLELQLDRDVAKIRRLLADTTILETKARNAHAWSTQYTIEAFDNEIQEILTL